MILFCSGEITLTLYFHAGWAAVVENMMKHFLIEGKNVGKLWLQLASIFTQARGCGTFYKYTGLYGDDTYPIRPGGCPDPFHIAITVFF